MKIKKTLLKAPLTVSTFLLSSILSYSQLGSGLVTSDEINDFVVVAPRRAIKNESLCYYELNKSDQDSVIHTLQPNADQVRIYILRDTFFVTASDNDPPIRDYNINVITKSNNSCSLNANTNTNTVCLAIYDPVVNSSDVPIAVHSERHNQFLYETLIFPRNEQYERDVQIEFKKQEDGLYNTIWIFESGKEELTSTCSTIYSN